MNVTTPFCTTNFIGNVSIEASGKLNTFSVIQLSPLCTGRNSFITIPKNELTFKE
jgi:hypothetical protein